MGRARWLLLLALPARAGATEIVLRGAGSSFAHSLYQEVIKAYTSMRGPSGSYTSLSSSRGLCRIMNMTTECEDEDISEPYLIDWAGCDDPPSSEQLGRYPDLRMYPTAGSAIVPVYNLPNVTADDPPLLLAPEVLASIFRSSITRWDDPRIADTNPELAAAGKLPSAHIVIIVRSDASGMTRILRENLARFEPVGFGDQVGVSNSRYWGNASVVHCISGDSGAAPCVMSTPFSIGYTGLSEVITLSLCAVSLLNPVTGSGVRASSDSVASAMAEFGVPVGSSNAGPLAFVQNINNGQSSSAWPIASLTYLVMRKDTSLFMSDERCDRRRETLLFWHWFYKSDIVELLAQRTGYVTLPAVAREAVRDVLEEDVRCDGALVYEPQAPTAQVRGGGVGWLRSHMSRVNLLYEPALATYQDVGSSGALDMLTAGLLDFVTINYHSLGSSSAYSPDSYVVVPYVGVALGVAYSFCNMADEGACLLANLTLRLDATTLAALLDANITRWLDPRIVALNPWMATEPYASEIGASREVALVGESLLSDTTQLASQLLAHYTLPVGLAAFSPEDGRAIIEPNAELVQARIQALPFSLGVVPITSTDSGPVAHIVAPRNVSIDVVPSRDSVGRCTGHAHDRHDVWHIRVGYLPECYPLTATIVFVLPRDHNLDNSTQGVVTYWYLHWLSTVNNYGRVYESASYPLDELAPAVVSDALRSIICNGVPCSDAHINFNHLGIAPKILTAVPGVFLIIFLGAACGIFLLHRSSATVKAAQPAFLVLVACGCILYLAALGLAMLDHEGLDPMESVPFGVAGTFPVLDVACCAQVWLYYLGSSLMYGALVAKLWRVTMIMVNPSMREVRVPLSEFLKFIGALVLFDVIALVLWTAVVPPYYRVEVYVADEYTGLETWHGSCDLIPEGSATIAIVLFLKHFMLVALGSYLCHRSRHVSRRYSDGHALSFVLAGHVERTAGGVVIGWFIYPFTEQGSPIAFFLVQWLIVMGAVMTLAFFIFAWRLLALVDELWPFGVGYGGQAGGGHQPPTITRLSRDGSSEQSGQNQGTYNPAKVCPAPPTSTSAMSSGGPARGSDWRPMPASLLKRGRAHDSAGNDGLSAALAGLQLELQIAQEELYEARDEMTELRERNLTLLTQLEDVREQRDRLFLINTSHEGEDDAELPA